ncbi:hypothetical protein DFA_07594 [Cavenderia fasciculata]|uniref:Uncharacterized protein n=1 Tax=Cavenderia fasciculata TaxID=261658 RepID=F4Q630_CACFS|nr:uncharacterized protein DFA_07594 [Cavenderia fasciculata]EGG16616.1 hypothetical protein DFA_07594 [Cavenderia fasciculata]|eukprot:XP_004355090.1 hypothetical protein DFA_07594 [Cavenderia fasciculata]
MGNVNISNDLMESAVEAILSYKDHNRPDGSGIYTFWPQIYNQTKGIYTIFPVNLLNLMNTFGSFENAVDKVAQLFKWHGILEDMKLIAQMMDTFKVAFEIPPDSDDSGVNLALGYQLSTIKHMYPQTYQTWQLANPNTSNVFSTYLEYAYRPFTNESSDSNSIDPRSYFMMHEFLESLSSDLQDSFLLPTTWMMSISEQKQTFPYLQMPFNVNNIDLSVSINSLFGIASATRQYILENNGQLPDFFTQDIENLCQSIASTVSWAITSGRVYNRTDITLLYYPSTYDFSWFISRLVALLQEFQQPPSSLEYALDTLLESLQGPVTDHLLQAAMSETVGQKTYYFWDDFLGDADTDLIGQKVLNGDDRLFSTSLAVMTLIDTWTTRSGNSNTWLANTPTLIKTMVDGAIDFINDRALKDKEQTYNAFFSGSMKGSSTYTLAYPSNRCFYINGTECDPHLNNQEQYAIVSPFSGVVDAYTYQDMIGQLWANTSTPTTWTGFNPEAFPYWSSTPLTHAFCLLSLSKYLNFE